MAEGQHSSADRERSSNIGPKTMVPLSWVLSLFILTVSVVMWVVTTTAGLRSDIQLLTKDVTIVRDQLSDKTKLSVSEQEITHWVLEMRRANPALTVPEFQPMR